MEPITPLAEYATAASAFLRATAAMKEAAANVSHWAPAVANWKGGDLVRSGATVPIDKFPSGTHLVSLYRAYAEKRAELVAIYKRFDADFRGVLKSPDTIEAEAS